VIPLQSQQQPQSTLQQTTYPSYSKAAYSNSYNSYSSYDPNYASYGYDNYTTPISTIPVNLSALYVLIFLFFFFQYYTKKFFIFYL
jgi:hypothetical protein